MKTILASAALAIGLTLAPMAAQAQNTTQNLPVTGLLPDGGAFAGTFDLQNFVYQNGVIRAVGTLSGTLTSVTGAVVGTVTDVLVSLPLTNATGACDILHLDLGPLNLDLLGLRVHLDQVVLDVVAQSGAGNLLGNLLCAVANLLNGNASGNAIANLLNRIVGLLG